jgi:hypothetical protein
MSEPSTCGYGCVVGYAQDPECPVHGDPDLELVIGDGMLHLLATGRAHFVPSSEQAPEREA